MSIFKYIINYVRYRMNKKLRTFEAVDEEYIEFKALCAKERIGVGEKLNEFIAKYLKEHGDGNPQFTLEQFEDPNFIACPAFYRDGLAWESYMKQATPEELSKIRDQVVLIDKKLGRHI